MKRSSLPLLILGGVLFAWTAEAQAREGVMSDREVESLRDAAYVPQDRIVAYEKILDSRAGRVDALLKARRHVSFEQDLHDLLDQISAIADELNDNLDEYREKHRDVRKVLPRLVEETDRWAKSLQATPEEPDDKVIRKLAISAVRDVREQVMQMQTELEEYFKAHPEAALAEKQRLEHAHDPRSTPK